MTRSSSSQPLLRRGLDHRVLAADLVRRDRIAEGLLHAPDQVEVRQRRLDHDDVGAFVDVQLDLAQRLVGVGRIHLVAAPVAELRRRLRRLAERPVEAGRELGGVGHDRRPGRSPPRRAPRGSHSTRPSIMSDGATMSAPARACVSASLASRSRVASLSTSPSAMHAAVAVVGVLAQADVGDHHQVGHRLLDRPHRLRHDAVVAIRLRAGGVLLLGNAEQDHRRNAEVAHRPALLDGAVDRQLRDARHRRRPDCSTRVPGTTNSGRMSCRR